MKFDAFFGQEINQGDATPNNEAAVWLVAEYVFMDECVFFHPSGIWLSSYSCALSSFGDDDDEKRCQAIIHDKDTIPPARGFGGTER